MNLVCRVCPMACNLKIVEDELNPSGYNISGNRCNRGIEYGLKEMTEPSRVLSSRVILKGGPMGRVPVKTDGVIASHLVDDVMDLIKDTVAYAPLKRGDVILENILGTKVNLIAARKVNKLEKGKNQ